MTTEEEQKDIEKLKADMQAKKLSTYDYMSSILNYTDRSMEASGYGKFTRAEAIKKILEDSRKDMKKLMDAHLKKYPD